MEWRYRMRLLSLSAPGFAFILGLLLSPVWVDSRAYAQDDSWFVPPEQPAADAPPIVHDFFEPPEQPVVKDPPPRNGWFYPSEIPTIRASPTVHKLALPELDARFRSFAASVPGMDKLPYFSQLVNSNRYTPAQAGEIMKDRTVLTYDEIYGPQIEYTSTDGTAYLWYPGNKRILRGQWYIRDEEVGFTQGTDRFVSTAGRVCYYYGANTYNPSTRRTGEPECQNAGVHEARVVESRAGDVLGLSTLEAVPFVLGDQSTSIDRVLGQIREGEKARK